EEAIARVIAGPERKSRMISENEKATIAYHEMGHALVGMTLEHTDPVHKISIVSRGMALGWTLSLPTEDRYLVSKAELLDQLAQMLGGRCAEDLILGEANITTGASDDIRKATDLARKMVTEWGLSDKLGPRTFGERRDTAKSRYPSVSEPAFAPESTPTETLWIALLRLKDPSAHSSVLLRSR